LNKFVLALSKVSVSELLI